MAAATVSSHMATNSANGATGGGPDGGNDVDNFVSTTSKDLQIMNFGSSMRNVSTSPPTTLNCVSNVIEDLTTETTTTSLVVLMMDSSTQTDGETEDNEEVELVEMASVASVESANNDNNNTIENNDNLNGVEISCSDDFDNSENDVCECEYEERIIDYDNFRIIEHVIDSRPHKNRRKCRELANHIQIIDNRTNSCKMNKLNNHNDYYNGFTFISDDMKTTIDHTGSADCDSIDNTIDNLTSSQSDSEDILLMKNSTYDLNADNKQFEKVVVGTVNGRVDDNNNTTRSTDCSDSIDCSIVHVTKITEQNLEKLSICFSENLEQQQQQQCKQLKGQEFQPLVVEQAKQTRKTKNKQHIPPQPQQQQKQLRKQATRNFVNDWDTLAPGASTGATPGTQFNSLIALKAFQSKLTPLAPPFHPSGVIDHKMTTTTTLSATTTTSSTVTATDSTTTTTSTTTTITPNATAAMYAFERTTIFYQQQEQQQQQPQPQQQQQQHVAKHQQKSLWSQQYAQHQFTTTTIQKQQSIKQQITKQPQQQHPPQKQQQQQLMSYKTNKKLNKQFNTNQSKQQQPQQQLVTFQAQQPHQQQQQHQHQQQQHQQQQVSLLPTPTTVPSLTHGQVFPLQFIPLLSPMPPTLSLLLPTQQKSQQQQQQQQGQGQFNALGGNNDANNSIQQQHQQQQINSHVATMGNAGGAWPLVEAPIFIDANGEYCTYCPAHGTPLMAGLPPPPSLPIAGTQAQAQAPAQAALLPPPPPVPVPTATSLTQQRQQHSKHIPMIGVTPNQQQQNREGCNLLSSSSANNSIGTTPSGSPSPTPNPGTLGPIPTAVPVYFKLESGVTTLPLQIAGKSTVLRGK